MVVSHRRVTGGTRFEGILTWYPYNFKLARKRSQVKDTFLSNRDRKRCVRKNMERRIERWNSDFLCSFVVRMMALLCFALFFIYFSFPFLFYFLFWYRYTISIYFQAWNFYKKHLFSRMLSSFEISVPDMVFSRIISPALFFYYRVRCSLQIPCEVLQEPAVHSWNTLAEGPQEHIGQQWFAYLWSLGSDEARLRAFGQNSRSDPFFLTTVLCHEVMYQHQVPLKERKVQPLFHILQYPPSSFLLTKSKQHQSQQKRL